MSGLLSSEARARIALRVAYLRAHGEHLPGPFGDITPHQRADLQEMAMQMFRRDLYYPNYEHRLVRWGIRVILGTIRGEPALTYHTRALQRYRS